MRCRRLWVPKKTAVELSPKAEDEIDSILAIFDDPAQRAEWEVTLRRNFTGRAELADAYDKVRQEAFGRAVTANMADPADYADKAVKLARMERIAEKQLAGVRRRGKTIGLGASNLGAELAEVASRTANPNQRRNQQRDRKYLEIVGAAERNGQLTQTGLVGSKITKALGSYRLPHWEKTTIPLKVLALSYETAKREGRTINLRISHEAQEKALASSRGPVSFVQNQVRETLKRRFEADAPEFWFVMEWDGENRFHLHGGYELQSHIDHQLIDTALRNAGGWSGAAASGLAQVSTKLIDPIVWASYVMKHLNLTATVTDRKLLASTAQIRDAARGSWDGLRSRLPASN